MKTAYELGMSAVQDMMKSAEGFKAWPDALPLPPARDLGHIVHAMRGIYGQYPESAPRGIDVRAYETTGTAPPHLDIEFIRKMKARREKSALTSRESKRLAGIADAGTVSEASRTGQQLMRESDALESRPAFIRLRDRAYRSTGMAPPDPAVTAARSVGMGKSGGSLAEDVLTGAAVLGGIGGLVGAPVGAIGGAMADIDIDPAGDPGGKARRRQRVKNVLRGAMSGGLRGAAVMGAVGAARGLRDNLRSVDGVRARRGMGNQAAPTGDVTRRQVWGDIVGTGRADEIISNAEATAKRLGSGGVTDVDTASTVDHGLSMPDYIDAIHRYFTPDRRDAIRTAVDDPTVTAADSSAVLSRDKMNPVELLGHLAVGRAADPGRSDDVRSAVTARAALELAGVDTTSGAAVASALSDPEKYYVGAPGSPERKALESVIKKIETTPQTDKADAISKLVDLIMSTASRSKARYGDVA